MINVAAKRANQPRNASEQALLARIKAIHEASGGTYGVPRVFDTLRERGVTVPYRMVQRLMAGAQIVGLHDTKRAAVDLDYPANLVARKWSVRSINRVWAGDITYVSTDEGHLHVAVMLDLCSRKVIGWHASTKPDTALTLAALHMAVMDRLPGRGLIHHSDRGVQYMSAEYREALRRFGFRQSMSARATSLDNAVVESFFSTFKRELVRRIDRKSRAEVQSAINDWIGGVYNVTRKHSSLGYVSPLQFERARREQARKRSKASKARESKRTR